MKSVIIVGVHPHSTILLHQPVDGAGVASVNFYGNLSADRIVTNALMFFGVHLNRDTVRNTERNALPTGYGANRNQSFSYAVTGERCHSDATCPALDHSRDETTSTPDNVRTIHRN